MRWQEPVGDVLLRLPRPVRHLVPESVRDELRVRLRHYRPGDIAYHPLPAPLAPGLSSGPPDFVVVGWPDGSSRWLFDELSTGPGVATPAAVEEPSRFFSSFANRAFGVADAAEFACWFPRPDGELVGHWSPDGLAYPWIAPLLARAAPDARLIVVLADPLIQLLIGMERGTVGLAQHPGSDLSELVERGHYGTQLRRLFGAFPADRVLVVQWEQYVEDPGAQLDRCRRFLGLGPGDPVGVRWAPASLRPTTREPDAEVRARLSALYAAEVATVVELAPAVDPGRWIVDG